MKKLLPILMLFSFLGLKSAAQMVRQDHVEVRSDQDLATLYDQKDTVKSVTIVVSNIASDLNLLGDIFRKCPALEAVVLFNSNTTRQEKDTLKGNHDNIMILFGKVPHNNHGIVRAARNRERQGRRAARLMPAGVVPLPQGNPADIQNGLENLNLND